MTACGWAASVVASLNAVFVMAQSETQARFVSVSIERVGLQTRSAWGLSAAQATANADSPTETHTTIVASEAVRRSENNFLIAVLLIKDLVALASASVRRITSPKVCAIGW